MVVGHGRELVEAYLAKAFGDRVTTAVQKEQKGTGDAARAGLEAVKKSTHALVFYGDVPLLAAEDVAKVGERLFAEPRCEVTLATCEVDAPFGYAASSRREGQLTAIREEKESEERRHAPSGTSTLALRRSIAFLKEAIASLREKRASELYLTTSGDSRARRKTFGGSVRAGDRGHHDRDQSSRGDQDDARIAGRCAGGRNRPAWRAHDDGARSRAMPSSRGSSFGRDQGGEGATTSKRLRPHQRHIEEGAIVKPYSV